MVDFPGRMAALFFTSGCNFRCGYCHNPDLLDGGDRCYNWDELGEILQRFRRQWVRAVTITGGEPTLHEGLPDTIAFMKKQGFAIKMDTNGSRPEMLARVLPQLDYVAMDLKCSLDSYPALTGFTDIEAIRRSLALVQSSAKAYEFRTTVLETLHTDEELHDCGKLIQGAELSVIQPFVPHDNVPSLALRQQPRTRPSRLHEAAAILRGYVRKVIIRGE